jgi:hypothetical protein
MHPLQSVTIPARRGHPKPLDKDIGASWRSPITRQRGGSPRRNRHVRRLALPPGWRVVALGSTGCHTLLIQPLPRQFSWLAIPETCPPGEGMVWVDLLPKRIVLANDDHILSPSLEGCALFAVRGIYP